MTDRSAAKPVSSDPTRADSIKPPDRRVGDITPPVASRATRNPLRRTRAGVAWVGIIVFTVVLVLLLIFILQNTQSVEISYFGASGNVSLAAAMLLSAVAGTLLAATAGSLRIWQLRRYLRRTEHR